MLFQLFSHKDLYRNNNPSTKFQSTRYPKRAKREREEKEALKLEARDLELGPLSHINYADYEATRALPVSVDGHPSVVLPVDPDFEDEKTPDLRLSFAVGLLAAVMAVRRVE